MQTSDSIDLKEKQISQQFRETQTEAPLVRRLSGDVPASISGPVRIPDPSVSLQTPNDDKYSGRSRTQSCDQLNSPLTDLIPLRGQQEAVVTCNADKTSHPFSGVYHDTTSSYARYSAANNIQVEDHYHKDASIFMNPSSHACIKSRSLDSKPSILSSMSAAQLGLTSTPQSFGPNRDMNQVRYKLSFVFGTM